MKTKQKKALAFLLSAVLILSLGSTAFAEEPSGEGSIEEITQYGTVTGDNISVAGSTLDWVAADAGIGRYQDGWWVGVKIIAPASVTEANVANVMYSNDGTDTLAKNFGTNNDGKTGDGRYYMGCWPPITPEYLETALANNSSLQWTYKFDWNGDNTVDQTFTITVDPSNITLMQNNAVFCKTENGVMTVKNGKNVVATVGGKGYESLQAAINAANAGETVKLLEDTNENVTIASGSFTLDLNGKTLDGGTTAGKAALTNNGGNVVITDSVGSGQIKRSDTSKAGCYYTILNNSGTLEIAGGKVYNHAGGNEPTPWSGASLICNGPHAEATLIISGGHIEQDNFIAVKNDACGILKITGGTITSKTQSVQNWCEAELSGGTLTGTVLTAGYVANGTVSAGHTVVSGSCSIKGNMQAYWYDTNPAPSPSNLPTIEVRGGSIDGKLVKATMAGIVANDDANSQIVISGGTFTSPVPDEFCAPGYHPEELENGGYGVSDYYHTGTTGSGLVSGGVVSGTGTNTGAVTDPSLLPPQTGDAGSVGIVGALLLLASCGMAGIALRRSAKKREMN